MGDFKSRLITRKTGFWTDCIPAAVFLSLMLMLAGLVFSAVLDHVLGVRTWLQGLGSDTAAQFAQFYLDFFGILLAAVLVKNRGKGEKRDLWA